MSDERSVTKPDKRCDDCIKNGGDYECDHIHCHKGKPANNSDEGERHG